MAKKKIDAQEYRIRNPQQAIIDKVKETLSKFIGKEVLISSNIERLKSKDIKKIKIFHIGQQYNELGQVLTLENPSLPKSEIPQILIKGNMEISQSPERVTIKYPRELSFRALTKPIYPDLEIYIEEVKE